MSKIDIDSITAQLGRTCIPNDKIVSFQSLSLKLDTEEDAKVVVERIQSCPQMEVLNLEGNTVGVPAAEAIAAVLETQGNLKQALWKDMFTGRMKTEIPLALNAFSKALIKAGAKLEVLDLSDNASGPIGVGGIEELLKSPVCYSLKELKLNNMGLGIQGAKVLAEALMHCYTESKKANEPLQMKVFIAGRNRLENEGAIALAKVFKTLGSLEEVQIPQNGIYYDGVKALAEAFSKNTKLKTINLNDNTLNPEGTEELSRKALPKLFDLTTLDVGDCLIKNEGAFKLAVALQTDGLRSLKEVNVGFNSIKAPGGLALVNALRNKPNLSTLTMDGNQFGFEGKEKIREALHTSGKVNALGSLSDDEGDSDEETADEDDDSSINDEDYGNEEEVDEEEEGEHQNEDEYLDESESSDEPVDNGDTYITWTRPEQVSARAFLANPTSDNLRNMGYNPKSMIMKEIERYPEEEQVDELLEAIIKVSSLVDPEGNLEDPKVKTGWDMELAQHLYKTLFRWATERECLSHINNKLPVLLGLIKDEETRKIKPGNRGGCILAVTLAMKQAYFPNQTSEILTALMKSKKQEPAA